MKKRFLGIILSAIMVMTLLCVTPIKAYAGDSIKEITVTGSLKATVGDMIANYNPSVTVTGGGQNLNVTNIKVLQLYEGSFDRPKSDDFKEGTQYAVAITILSGDFQFDNSGDDFIVNPDGQFDFQFTGKETSITIYGLIEIENKPSPGPSPDPAPTPGHTHNYEWQIINEPSLEADGLEAEVCTICGARRNEQNVSAFGYALYSYGLNKLNGAKSGDTVILEFGEWNSFPKQFMEKVKEKVDAGVTVVFKFNYQHAPYEITIPAYSTVYTNLEWCGPACMYQLYVLKIPVEN